MGRVKATKRTVLRPGMTTKAIVYTLLVIWAVGNLYPFVWWLMSSLKSDYELINHTFGLPRVWMWVNYKIAFVQGKFANYFLNSVIYAFGSLVAVLLVSSMAAFVFARDDFRLKKAVYGLFIAAFLIPSIGGVLPLSLFLRHIGIYGTHWALTLIYTATGIPFAIFMLTTFMSSLPTALEESAVIDGASPWQVYQHVILPLSQPALVTLGIFHFLGTWNEFLIAIVFSSSEKTMTLPVGIFNLTSRFRANYTGVMAGMVMAAVPVIIFYAIAQDKVIKGITAGSLKV